MSETKTMTMRVSMDGLRRNLARAYCQAVRGFHEIIEGRNIDEFHDLKEGLSDLRQMIGSLMCVYSPNPDDMMTDMADESDLLPWADPEEGDDGDD